MNNNYENLPAVLNANQLASVSSRHVPFRPRMKRVGTHRRRIRPDYEKGALILGYHRTREVHLVP